MRIAVLPGDGVGPEVTAEAVRVLVASARRHGLAVETADGLIGGAALERTGRPLPAETVDLCRTADAVLLGAVGGPRWDDLPGDRRPERGLLELRRALGVYANLRPARVFPSLLDRAPLRPEVASGTDLLIVRELTGGLYFGTPRGRDGDEAVDTLRYRRQEIRRLVRTGLDAARRRRRRLTSVDKANVLETSRLWREVVVEEAAAFPEVAVEHMLVDTCAMQLVRAPRAFDVIVTENMFGDILSDEAGAVVGSMGLLPSASLGETPPFLYEPVHGSAPDIAGKGIANPVGAILSAALMVRHSFRRPEIAAEIEAAVEAAIAAGVRTPDLGGTATTAEMGEAVVAALSRVAGSGGR
ncbi:MAG: 3-isopropylmalate dehydrogenase [Armatimonadota bacterium]|nr:3-isopropylmalate dehydrogenase [Armatimonadota bacterium]MDR7450443.1 3-isopropylmalate dehydrogenase [Armatimonadota bacterium]MDR7466974.1 3-isopropylmalate dehydrogenase [Armatimonadota bacterium]MDR7493484.1 3-isopropylmalate dehydrogenase [Armatimonadota bacterium]MDR7498749.1 3-isopropylmalate dehydrogenase [Armatimonadota bacterium]